jgi:hypothetical protein
LTDGGKIDYQAVAQARLGTGAVVQRWAAPSAPASGGGGPIHSLLVTDVRYAPSLHPSLPGSGGAHRPLFLVLCVCCLWCGGLSAGACLPACLPPPPRRPAVGRGRAADGPHRGGERDAAVPAHPERPHPGRGRRRCRGTPRRDRDGSDDRCARPPARPPSEKRRETARNGSGLGAHAAPPRPRTDPISGVPVLLCAEGTAVVARALGDGGPPPPRPLLAELARCGRASSLPAMRLRWPYARGRRGWPAGQPASRPALEVSASARTCAWRVRGGCSCRVECGGAVAALAAAGGGAAAEQRHGGALVALAGGAVHGLQLS